MFSFLVCENARVSHKEVIVPGCTYDVGRCVPIPCDKKKPPNETCQPRYERIRIKCHKRWVWWVYSSSLFDSPLTKNLKCAITTLRLIYISNYFARTCYTHYFIGTCILCNVMEHISASKFARHFNKHQILYELRHGFREKRLCNTQLIQFVEDRSRQHIQVKQDQAGWHCPVGH